MQVQIPHKFTKKEALARVRAALQDARPKLAGKASITEERWEEAVLHFAFTAEGQAISGTLEVREQDFNLYAKLPLMLRMFEGRLKSAIEQQAKQMLG